MTNPEMIDGLGPVRPWEMDGDVLALGPVDVPLMGGLCLILLEEYRTPSETDPAPEDYHAAVAAFRAAGPDILAAATGALEAMRADCLANLRRAFPRSWEKEQPADPAGDVWDQITWSEEVHLRRAPDGAVYAALVGGWPWDPDPACGSPSAAGPKPPACPATTGR